MYDYKTFASFPSQPFWQSLDQHCKALNWANRKKKLIHSHFVTMGLSNLTILTVLACVLVCYGSISEKVPVPHSLKNYEEDVCVKKFMRAPSREGDSMETKKGEDDAKDAVPSNSTSRIVANDKTTRTSLNKGSRYFVSGYYYLPYPALWRFKCHVYYARVVRSIGYCRFPSTLALSGRYIIVVRPCYWVYMYVRLWC